VDGSWDEDLIKSLFWPVEVHFLSFKFLSHQEERILLHGTTTGIVCSQSGLLITLNGNINLKEEEQEKEGMQVECEITRCGTDYGS
jgi:hypothetical protein